MARYVTESTHSWVGGGLCRTLLLVGSDLSGVVTLQCNGGLSRHDAKVPWISNIFVTTCDTYSLHIFPVGQVLPNLKVLHIIDRVSSYGGCIQAPQIVRITASCTTLQALMLQGVTPEGFTKNALNVSCLSQLPRSVKRVQGMVWYR